MTPQLNIGDCLSDGWSGFKKNAGPAIGIVVIFALLSGAGGSIPVLNIIFSLVVSPIISAGLSIFALSVARGGEGKIDDLFKGFNKFGDFLGAYWFYVLIVVIAFIPAAIGFGIDVAIQGGVTGAVPYVTIAMGAAGVVGLIIAMLRWSMVYYLIIDGMGVMDSFRESARITKGFRGKLFLLVLVNVLIMLGGFMLLFFGLLVTAPVTLIAFAAAYNRLKTESQPSAVLQGPGPGATPAVTGS